MDWAHQYELLTAARSHYSAQKNLCVWNKSNDGMGSWIENGEADLVQLAITPKHKLGLDEAIVVPAVGGIEQAARSVGLALGKFLSETITDNMTIGVGWGRTLTASLASFHVPAHSSVKVLSLLGGAVETRFANPVEFSWRLASALNAECYLFPAPLVVDSAETKRRLIQPCGLDKLYDMAEPSISRSSARVTSARN